MKTTDIRKELVFILFLLTTVANFAQMPLSTDSINVLLEEVLFRDQQVRNDYNKSVTKSDKEEKRRIWENADSLNLSIVLPIIDAITKGELSEISPNSWRCCFLILQHAPFKIQMDYRDFVMEYYKKGYIMAYEYMIFMDRLLVNQRKAQLFGSQVVVFPGGKKVQFPLCKKSIRDSAIISLGYSPSNVRMKNGCFSITLSGKDTDKGPTTLSVFSSKIDSTKNNLDDESSILPGSLELAKEDFGIILCMGKDFEDDRKRDVKVLMKDIAVR